MRISVCRRKNPYYGDETDDASVEEESKFFGRSSKNPLKPSIEVLEGKLSQTKLVTLAKDVNSSDALARLMRDRYKQDEILSKIEKMYSCDMCLKKFKVYDAFNDDPSKCFIEDDIELVDENTFNEHYLCDEDYRVVCPNCKSL
ncbi:unnamed protein product [Moneuplotes crassus]|uniref:Uncharacterized protein n=1 Tax=Euplotes crassus TaxID=5936 RepID=A0AAD2D6D0_EUPCR|nr:unnamed protein product [Moneuplotes crassus]